MAPPPFKKARKSRKAFTSKEKLDIVNESLTKNIGQDDLCAKHGIGQTKTLREWIKEKARLEKEVAEGRGTLARRMKDPLEQIKNAIYKKWEINNAMPKSAQLRFTQDVMMASALEMKEALLKQHKDSGDKFLSKKELMRS